MSDQLKSKKFSYQRKVIIRSEPCLNARRTIRYIGSENYINTLVQSSVKHRLKHLQSSSDLWD